MACFLGVFSTNFDIFASERGFLPFNSILLFVGFCSLLFFVLGLTGEIERSAERFFAAVSANIVPIGLFLLWVTGHVLLAGRAVVNGPDIDLTRVFPVYQFGVLMFGFALAATSGFRQAFRFAASAAILLLGASVVLDTLVPGLLGPIAVRSGGFALNANVAAFNLNALLAMCLDFRRFRLWDMVLTIIVAIAVFSTLSRSGLAQFSVIAAVYFLVHGGRAFDRGRLGLLVVAGAAPFGFLALLMYFGGVLGGTAASGNAEFLERLDVLNFRGPAIYEDPYRGVLLRHYLQLALEQPFFGFGSNYTLSTAILEAPYGLGPHNMYIRAWIDLGLLGLVAYVVFLVCLVVTMIMRRYINGTLFCIITMQNSFFSHNVIDSKATLLLIGMALAHSSLRRMKA